MSGMDDRAKQFKVAAEAQPTGPALKKEINTLRRFLFRNQEYRFTKAAQQALYMAVIAHYGNPAAHHTACVVTAAPGGPTPASSSRPAAEHNSDGDGEADDDSAAEAPILRLLDDALKMPFTVFTSPQKDKLLSLYWAVLGTGGTGGGSGAAAVAASSLTLSLMDIVSVGKNKAQLSLFTEDGDEYAHEVLVDDAATLKELRTHFDKGNSVTVTVQETDTGACFVSFAVDDA